jgi:hypothetical protein
VRIEDKIDQREERYAYTNRRAEMYGLLRSLVDPVEQGWGIPTEYYDCLVSQLSVLPLLYDEEGRMYMLPKNRKRDSESKRQTLTELIGHSPDESDALVLAVYGMLRKAKRAVAGAI